jgi:hypothetical protein
MSVRRPIFLELPQIRVHRSNQISLQLPSGEDEEEEEESKTGLAIIPLHAERSARSLPGHGTGGNGKPFDKLRAGGDTGKKNSSFKSG